MLSKTKPKTNPQTRDTTEKAQANEGVTVIVLRDGGIQEMTVPASDTELRFLSSALATRDKKRVNATIMGSVADGRIVFFANESIMLASHAASSTDDPQPARVPPSLLPSKLPPMFGPVAIVGFKHAFHAPSSVSASVPSASSADTKSQRLQTLSMQTYAQVAKIALHAPKPAAKAKQTKNTETETATATTKPPKKVKAETETVDAKAQAKANVKTKATEPRTNGNSKSSSKGTTQLKLEDDDDMHESESSESDSENEAALLRELIESDDSD